MRFTRVILSMAVVEHSIADICDFVQNACLVRVDHSIHKDSDTLAESSNNALVEIFSTALGVPAEIQVDLFQPLKIYGHTYHTLATKVHGSPLSGDVENAYLITVSHMRASVQINNSGVELASRVALMNMLVSRALSFPVSDHARETAFRKALQVTNSERNLNLMEAEGMNLNGLVRSMQESGYGESFAYILGPACIFALSEMLVNDQAYTAAMAKVRMALLLLAASIEHDGLESVQGRLAFLRDTIGMLAVMDFHIAAEFEGAIDFLDRFSLSEFEGLATLSNNHMRNVFSQTYAYSVTIEPEVLMDFFVATSDGVELLFRYFTDLRIHKNKMTRASRVALVNVFARKAWITKAVADGSRTNALNLATYLIKSQKDIAQPGIALTDLIRSLTACKSERKPSLLLAFLIIGFTEAVIGNANYEGPYTLAVNKLSKKLQSLMKPATGGFRNMAVADGILREKIFTNIIDLSQSIMDQAVARPDWIATFASDGHLKVLGQLNTMISAK